MMNYSLIWKRNFISILLLFAALPAGAQKPFSVREVMSAPHPTHLVSAKKTDRIAWVVYEEGLRNIYTAIGPRFDPRRLTSYEEQDGQQLSNLQISDDGSVIVYVRGGRANRQGVHPNPLSVADGTEQAAWAIKTSNDKPWKLAVTGNPLLSPSGQLVLFMRDNAVYQVPLRADRSASDSPPQPQLLFRALGQTESLVWSPDSRRVAFVSDRRDHRFVGVIDRETRKITWMAPSVERDGNPVWSPDGKEIAFSRRRGAGFYDHAPSRSGGRFTVWIARADTGEGRRVWDPKAVEQMPASIRNFQWAGDHFVFSSPLGEWTHLFSVPVAGGTMRQLTPGGGIIEHHSLSSDGKWIYFDTNTNDKDRRHIWKVPTNGEQEAVRLTQSEDIETYPVVLSSNNKVAHFIATARHPLCIAVISTKGGESRVIAPAKLPKEFPLRELVIPEPVTLTAEDGFESYGQLFLPKDAQPGDGRPAVVFIHGGPRRQMLLGWHYSHYYSLTYAFNQYLANRGYLVLSVNYRMGIGYGRSFSRAPNTGRGGGAEYLDVLAAGRYLQTRPEVDPARVGLWGGSYGGYLTALGLAKNSDVFAAGVDLNGCHERAGGQREGVAYESSPIAYIDSWRSPVFLAHGDDDRSVAFSQTTGLYQLLRDRDVHVELLVYPDEVHAFLIHDHVLEFYEKAADFFDRFLKTSANHGTE